VLTGWLDEPPGFSPVASDQPLPEKGTTRVLDLVQKDLSERAEVGLGRYGRYLETRNGRDALMDAYQEALDLVMYLRQEIAERNGE
jgi:hypothetical protein